MIILRQKIFVQMIPEEISDKKIFRGFLFRKYSIIFDLTGRKWMIRFFAKKSSSK